MGVDHRPAHVRVAKKLVPPAAELVELVGVLDGINRYRFAESPQLLGAWNSARNVTNPVRGKALPPPAEGGIDKAA